MSMIITNNISALNTQRWLNINNSAMSSSLQKLSSGYRINVAADDPAGLVISEKLRAQNVGLERAVQNTEEASNVIGIAEGALTEMNSVLETMRELALHAANDGVTSSDEIEADQAEMDSAIQTIDNIATTTKYSNEYLLSGNQALTYDTTTVVNKSTDNALLNTTMTKVNQISSTKDYAVNVSFYGASDTAESTASLTVNAQRAFIESSIAGNSATDYSVTTSLLTADQEFTISGNGGSKTFSFSTGTSLGEIASTISNSSADTGVGCALVFDSNVYTTATTVAANAANIHTTGEAQIFSFANATCLSNGTVTQYNNAAASTYNVNLATLNNVVVGKNSDDTGNVYVVWTGTNSCKVYSDSSLTTLVATGATNSSATTTVTLTEANDSDITGNITISGATTNGAITMISFGAGMEFYSTSNNATLAATGDGIYDSVYTSGLETTLSAGGSNSVINGVVLGKNTDADGNIYVKSVVNNGGAITVYLYNDSSMSDDSLLCSSNLTNAYANAAASTMTLYDSDTGLQVTLDLAATSATVNSTTTGTISMTNFGLRLYSTSYGDDQYVKVEVDEGELWTNPDDSTKLITSDDGEVVDYGQNAVVTVNGQRVELNGTSGTVSTADLNADLVFNQGELGATTIATVGYDMGTLASTIGDMTDKTNYATQAINNTTDVLDNFEGGMTFQLGEGSGESTIYSIESMISSNLGETEVTKDFDGDGDEETKTLSLADLEGGGYACLATDATTALDIIDNAIDDVSALRARLGATQSNLLETNVNSLNVAIENITATESAIRDVDMATETTEYTKNQILVQSATSMLAQANSASQNVLTLLQSL